jgi:hypothetical protein
MEGKTQMSTALDDFVQEVTQTIVKDEPTPKLKGVILDTIALSSLVLQIVQWLFNWWMSRNKPPASIKTEAAKIGPVKRAFIQAAIFVNFKKEGKPTDHINKIVKTTLQKLAEKDTTTIQSICDCCK